MGTTGFFKRSPANQYCVDQHGNIVGVQYYGTKYVEQPTKTFARASRTDLATAFNASLCQF